MSDIDEGRIKIGELENKPVYLNQSSMGNGKPQTDTTDSDLLTQVYLRTIKGLGKETIADILRFATSRKELIKALEEDKAPFRNDVVIILKKEMLKGGN